MSTPIRHGDVSDAGERRAFLRPVGRAFLLRGALVGLLGLCTLFWPSASLALLVRVVGLLLVMDGVAGLVGGLRAAGRAYLLQPLISLAAGLLLLLWPDATARTLFMVFGAWALFMGVSQIFAARRADALPDERGVGMGVGVATAVIGLVLLVWPGAGVVGLSWLLAFGALLVAAFLIAFGLALRRLEQRIATRPRRSF